MLRRTPRFAAPLAAALSAACFGVPPIDDGAPPPADVVDADADADADADPSAPLAEVVGEGRVRALHLARGVPVLRLTFDDGNPMVDGLAFGGSTERLPMPTGDHDFAVESGAGAQLAATETLALEPDARWSIAVWQDVDAVRAALLRDADGSGYRVVHLLPSGGAITARFGGAAAPTMLVPGAAGDVAPTADTLALDVDADGDADATYQLPGTNDAVVDLFVVAGSGDAPATVLASTPSGLIEVPADGAVPPARVRAIHLSPNAPAVDAFANGGLAFAGLEFGGASTTASVPAGLYDVDVAPAGAGVGSSVLAVEDLELLSARSYSVVAYGNLPGIRALALVDDLSPVAAGSIRVRAAHTADGVGQVDVLALGATNSVVYDDVDFGAVGAYVELPAAAIDLGLDVDDDLAPEFTFSVPALPIGTVATIFAVLDDDGPFLVAATQDATIEIRPTPPAPPATIRVVHLSPDAPAVAVNANGARLVESLSFFGASSSLQVAAGRYDLDVALASSPDAPLLSIVDAELAAGATYTAVAFGRASDLRALTLVDDRTPPAAGNVRVRAVHTGVGLGDVDVYAMTSGGAVLLIDDLAFGTAAPALELPAGDYTLGLDLDHDAHPDLVFTLPHLSAGTIANAFAVVDAHGNASLALQP